VAQDLTMPDRQQVFYANAISVAAGQTLPETTTFGSGAAGAYTISRAAAEGHLKGMITGTQVPAAGFPRVRFWMAPGDSTVLTSLLTYVLPVDPNNANSFLIDMPLWTPWFTIEWTMGATPGTVSGAAWVYPYISIGSSSGAGGPIYVKDGPLTPLGYAQFTTLDGTTAKTMAQLAGGSVPAGAIYALIQVDSGGTNATIRWRDDGVAPTSSVGFPLIPGVQFMYECTPLTAFQAIGTAAGPSTINLSFYK
jgi:hypothetical protein